MRSAFIKIFFLTPLFLFLTNSEAQVSNDAGLWSTFTVQKPLNKRFTLVIDQELRLKENFQRLNLFYTNFGTDIKISKGIKLSPTYRAIQKCRLDGTFSHRHRLMLDLTLKKKLNKISLSERIRYQTEVQDYFSSRKGPLPEQFLRFKTDLKYSLSDDLTPFFSCELRYQIRSPRGDGPLYDNSFHRIRNVLGFDYQLNKKNTATIYYLIQTEFNISTPENIYIVGLAYTITL